MGSPAEEQLNNSIQALEYNISNAIRRLTIKIKPKVAFIQGQGELDKYQTADAMLGLEEYYDVDRVKINANINSLRIVFDTANGTIVNRYKAIIIAKPDSAFTEKDKFIIDQHIMHGGEVIMADRPCICQPGQPSDFFSHLWNKQ